MPWLLFPETPKNLAAEMARSRDPGGFAALAALSRADPASTATKDLAARRIAAILAAKGGVIADIIVRDCLELLGTLAGRGDTSPYFYQLLHALGIFPRRRRSGPGVQVTGSADRRAAGRPLPDRLPAGPRPEHRLPAGTPARGRPRDATQPVPHAGRPVLA
jgi:hypothetical protein